MTSAAAFFHTVIRLICLFSRRDAEFTQRIIISHRKHRTNRAASAERCLHQFCRVAMEEDDSQITEIYYFTLIMFFSPADNDNLGPAEIAEMAEILITI